MTRCAFVYPEPQLWGDGRCGRFTSNGEALCASHSPERKAAVKVARILRARRRRNQVPEVTAWREPLMREIAELAVWWDGPGSEGRCV